MKIKEITLEDYDIYKEDGFLLFASHQGRKPNEILSDEFCHAIIDRYGNDGKIEIIKMEDRGQIFGSQAKRLLGEEYREFSRQVPVDWSEY